MPKGGRREGTGRPSGTGRFAEPARNMRVPHSLVGPVSEMLAEHLRSVAIGRRLSAKQMRSKALLLRDLPPAGIASVIGPVDATTMLTALADQNVKAAVVVLDPMYRAKQEAGRAAYLSETLPILEAAARVAPHVFLWGFPESVARLVDHWPSSLKLEAWLTWFFKNVPSRSKSWRPSQQVCRRLWVHRAPGPGSGGDFASSFPHQYMGPDGLLSARHVHGAGSAGTWSGACLDQRRRGSCTSARSGSVLLADARSQHGGTGVV